jgi:hypothetical protein
MDRQTVQTPSRRGIAPALPGGAPPGGAAVAILKQRQRRWDDQPLQRDALAPGGDLAGQGGCCGWLLRGDASVQSGGERGPNSRLRLQPSVRGPVGRDIERCAQPTRLVLLRGGRQRRAVLTPRRGARLRRGRGPGAHACAALRRPPQGDALPWRSYGGASARPVHRPGPAQPDSAGEAQTGAESPGVAGAEVLDGPRASPGPRGLGGSRRGPRWSGAPRKPAPEPGRSGGRGIWVEHSSSGCATLSGG